MVTLTTVILSLDPGDWFVWEVIYVCIYLFNYSSADRGHCCLHMQCSVEEVLLMHRKCCLPRLLPRNENGDIHEQDQVFDNNLQ